MGEISKSFGLTSVFEASRDQAQSTVPSVFVQNATKDLSFPVDPSLSVVYSGFLGSRHAQICACKDSLLSQNASSSSSLLSSSSSSSTHLGVPRTEG